MFNVRWPLTPAEHKRLGLSSRENFKRILRALKAAEQPGPVYQTPEQLADDTWHCGGPCGKTLGQLRSEGKVRYVDGYAQCADCHADIDNASRTPRKLTKDDWTRIVQLVNGRRSHI